MRNPNRTCHHQFTDRRSSVRARPAPARTRRPQLIADAVVASYIHEISVRHRRVPREWGDEVRPVPVG